MTTQNWMIRQKVERFPSRNTKKAQNLDLIEEFDNVQKLYSQTPEYQKTFMYPKYMMKREQL